MNDSTEKMVKVHQDTRAHIPPPPMGKGVCRHNPEVQPRVLSGSPTLDTRSENLVCKTLLQN